MRFYFAFLALFIMTATRHSPGILVSRLKSNRDSGFLSKIRTIRLLNSGRLDTLQGFFGGLGACSPGEIEIWVLQTAGNTLKWSILPSPPYFLYHFKSFTTPSGGPFCLLGERGGGCVCTPRTLPPAYGPGLLYIWFMLRNVLYG